MLGWAGLGWAGLAGLAGLGWARAQVKLVPAVQCAATGGAGGYLPPPARRESVCARQQQGLVTVSCDYSDHTTTQPHTWPREGYL